MNRLTIASFLFLSSSFSIIKATPSSSPTPDDIRQQLLMRFQELNTEVERRQRDTKQKLEEAARAHAQLYDQLQKDLERSNEASRRREEDFRKFTQEKVAAKIEEQRASQQDRPGS